MNYAKNRSYVLKNTDRRTLLEQLASYANDKWQRRADRIKEYLDRRNVTNVSKQ